MTTCTYCAKINIGVNEKVNKVEKKNLRHSTHAMCTKLHVNFLLKSSHTFHCMFSAVYFFSLLHCS